MNTGHKKEEARTHTQTHTHLRGFYASDSKLTVPFPPPVCHNVSTTGMISQAHCVFVLAAALAAVLQGVVARDNVAPWLELMTRKSAAAAATSAAATSAAAAAATSAAAAAPACQTSERKGDV